MESQKQITIGERKVGVGQPCFITVEVAQAHDGNLERAHAYIDAAATGVDAVKFQTHIANAESTPGLLFYSSPFSEEAVRLLAELGVPVWKVGAGEIGTLPMLEAMARTGKPVLLSSGMSTERELDDAVAIVRNAGARRWGSINVPPSILVLPKRSV